MVNSISTSVVCSYIPGLCHQLIVAEQMMATTAQHTTRFYLAVGIFGVVITHNYTKDTHAYAPMCMHPQICSCMHVQSYIHYSCSPLLLLSVSWPVWKQLPCLVSLCLSTSAWQYLCCRPHLCSTNASSSAEPVYSCVASTYFLMILHLTTRMTTIYDFSFLQFQPEF